MMDSMLPYSAAMRVVKERGNCQHHKAAFNGDNLIGLQLGSISSLLPNHSETVTGLQPWVLTL